MISETIELAIIGAASLPTGDDDYTSDAVDPGFILAAGMMLNERVSLGSQLSASFDEAGNGRALNSGATIVAGFPITGRVGGFTELAFEFPEDQDSLISFHTGLVLAMSSRSQLDVHGGFGMAGAAPDSFFGIGFSIKK